MNSPRFIATLLALGAATACPPTLGAESYDNCTGYIETLPASITDPGTWCLRGHRYTSQTTGAAIHVLADAVAIDCNAFLLSGLDAGTGTDAIGILAGLGRRHITVRNCRIQGFKDGVRLSGSGHLIENNHLDRNTYLGVYTGGDSNVVRGNFINATGGRPGQSHAFAIYAYVHSASPTRARVIGNTISNVSPTGDAGGRRYPRGIVASGLVQGNFIAFTQAGFAQGISLYGGGVARDNVFYDRYWSSRSLAIQGNGVGTSLCRDNDLVGWRFAVVPRIVDCNSVGDLNGLEPLPPPE